MIIDSMTWLCYINQYDNEQRCSIKFRYVIERMYGAALPHLAHCKILIMYNFPSQQYQFMKIMKVFSRSNIFQENYTHIWMKSASSLQNLKKHHKSYFSVMICLRMDMNIVISFEKSCYFLYFLIILIFIFTWKYFVSSKIHVHCKSWQLRQILHDYSNFINIPKFILQDSCFKFSRIYFS